MEKTMIEKKIGMAENTEGMIKLQNQVMNLAHIREVDQETKEGQTLKKEKTDRKRE